MTTRAWRRDDELTPYAGRAQLRRTVRDIARAFGWRGRRDLLPAAVLFDLDGLLVDSEPVWSVAEAEVMAWLGGPWNADVKAACLGKRIDVSCAEMVRIAGSSVDPVAVQERLLARVAELFRAELPWRPGAEALVGTLATAGIPMALVSSSYRVLVDAALETLDRSRFRTTIAGDEVSAAKPDPEPYRLAARRLGVAPGDCVVFEDSPTGVASAEAAGCVCVAVPDVVPIEPGPARVVVSSLAEVDLDWLRRLPYRREPTSAA